MIRKIVVLIALAGLIGAWAFSGILFPTEPMQSAQVKVRDGDTLTMMSKDVRLYGIDAPEYKQICRNNAGKDWPCGDVARQKLAAIIGNSEVVCEPKATDKYNRTIATCSTLTVPDIALALVEVGLAANGVDGSEGPYAVSESLAQVEKIGIWSGPFMTPADWRRANPRENAEAPNLQGKS
ncbi:MAG: thermonuclease family protein [Pseudomonadota bacterium]